MNVLQSNLTYAAGKLFFAGVPVAGFRSLKVFGDNVRVTLVKDESDVEQVKAMRLAGIKVRRCK